MFGTMSFDRLRRQFQHFLDALHGHVADGHKECSALEVGLQKRWAPIESMLAANADPLLVRDMVRSLPPITHIAHHHRLPANLSAEAERTAAAVSEAASTLVPLSLDWAHVDTRAQPMASGSSSHVRGMELSAGLARAGFQSLQGTQAHLAASFVRSVSNRTDMDCSETTHVLVEHDWAHEWSEVVGRLRPFFPDSTESLCMEVGPEQMLVASAGALLATLETELPGSPSSWDSFRLFDRNGRCACYWSEFGSLGLWRPRHVQGGRPFV